jgi:hypothetical protein
MVVKIRELDTRTIRDRQDSVGKHHLLSGPLRLCAFARGPARTLPTESVRERTRYRVQSVCFHTRMPGSLTQRRRGAEAQSVTNRMNALLRTPCSMKIRANGHPHEPRPPGLLLGTSGQEPQIPRIPRMDAVVETLRATSLPPEPIEAYTISPAFLPPARRKILIISQIQCVKMVKLLV